MKYVRAPEPFDWSNNPEVSLFLAGSISNAKNWQETITKIVHEGHTLETFFHIFNPRRENYNVLDPAVEVEQITWEYNAIHTCNHILFWFSHETLAPITLFELGSALKSHDHDDIYIGIDPEYKRKNDVIIQTRLRNPELAARIVYSQEELVKQIIESRI